MLSKLQSVRRPQIFFYSIKHSFPPQNIWEFHRQLHSNTLSLYALNLPTGSSQGKFGQGPGITIGQISGDKGHCWPLAHPACPARGWEGPAPPTWALTRRRTPEQHPHRMNPAWETRAGARGCGAVVLRPSTYRGGACRGEGGVWGSFSQRLVFRILNM